MNVTAQQIAGLVGGVIEGNPEATVSRPMRIEDAGPGDFAFFDNPKYESYAYTTGASILLVSQQFVPAHPVQATLIRVQDVRASLALLMSYFEKMVRHTSGKGPEISPQASIAANASLGEGTSVGTFCIIEEGAVIGAGCTISPQVYIGRNVLIGDHTVIYPGARILADTHIGARCIIHANAVLGTDGFGFAPLDDGSWKKVPHLGNVVIGNDVEIGAGTCIDRAAMGSTVISDGVKLDNLIHIAHNVEVGKNTVMAAQVGVAGSAKIGERVMLGGQSGIAGHITLAPGTRTQAQSGVGSNTKPDSALFGSPAIEYNQYVRAYIVFKDLPDMAKRLRGIEKKLG
jgi:UDP-3-O-[3-hydroxymyristoyl] glucosamine N-acyltransferase